MATTPYFKFFIGDYLADTPHLTTKEHGAYLLLILAYYRQGSSLPDDENRLSTIAKVSPKVFRKMRLTLSQFFEIDGKFWKHKRIEKELAAYKQKCSKNKASIEKRWEKEEEKEYTKRIQNVSPLVSETYYQNDTISEVRSHNSEVTIQNSQITNQKNIRDLSNDKSMSGLPDDAQLKNSELRKQAIEVLEFLNERTGRQYRPVDTNLKMIMSRMKSGVTADKCRQVIVKKWLEWGKQENMEKYLRPKTLFNATNFEQYVAELVKIPEGDESV